MALAIRHGLPALLALAWIAAPRAGGAADALPAVTWTENLNGALTRAQNELKPVLVVFASPSCPWCSRFKAETLADQKVLAALAGFVCVGIDTLRDNETAQSFQVRGVPAVMILSGDGRPQWGTEGFMDPTAFLAFLDVYRQGGGGRETMPLALDGWLKALQGKSVLAGQWPEMMSGLGIKACRTPLHQALLAYVPCPRSAWVELLAHPQLAVRLGAFELLEELAGSGHGYDPWFEAEANREALANWRKWAEAGTNETEQVYASLTEEQINGYIRDLASRDRERCARAVRMLERAGESVIPALESWAVADPASGGEALRQVKEIRYFLMLPESLGTERARLAHRLVFGNQDERLRSLAAASAAGERSLPVLADFLADTDPFIREAAVDGLISAGRNLACPYLSELLKHEKDEDVIHAVVRGAGRLKGPKAVELAGPFLSHANEDLVVAALASLSQTKSKTAAKAVAACLQNRQWRVRAAALEALGKLGAKSADEAIIVCLDDPDAFVRRTAVLTLAGLSEKKAVKRLSEIFLKDDPLKGPIVAALRTMDVPIPATFGPALEGKDPDVLLPVLDGLGNGGDESWRLALPFVGNANGDVACAAIRIVARGGGRVGEARAALAKVLREGVKERVLAVFESYSPAGDDDSFSLDDASGSEAIDELLSAGAASEGAGGGGSVESGALADVFAAFGAAPAATPATAPVAAPATTAAPPEPATLNDLFAAFGTAVASAPAVEVAVARRDESREDGDMLQAAVAYLAPGQDAELRFAAALMVMAMGNTTGVTFLVESLDSRTAEERLQIAQRAGRCRGDATLPLVARLLRDPSADVRQAAVALCLGESSGDRLTKALLETAFEPGTPLAPADLFTESYTWYRALQRAAFRRHVGVAVRQALAPEADRRLSDPQRILALTLLDTCWKTGDQAMVARHLEHENPFVRRAAWYAIGRRQPAAFLEKIKTVAEDPSEWVRAVVPAVYRSEGSSEWAVYIDADTTASPMSRNFSSSGSRARLKAPVAEVLRSLVRDPALPVRSAAALCLFENREKVELQLLSALLDTAPDRRMMAYRLASLLKEAPLGWLREMNVGELLGVVDAVLMHVDEEEDDEGERLVDLRQTLAAETKVPGAKVKVAPRQAEARRTMPVAGGGERPAGQGGAEAPDATAQLVAGARQRLVVFFRNPGCHDCERVEGMLKALAGDFTDLVVEVRNIRKPEDARINEALCIRFGVPDNGHLVAPAIFCGAGALIKSDITFERLGRLLSRPGAEVAGWRRLTETDTARAGQNLESLYAGMNPLLVFGAGLADGVNPCAFATIIFLLSYLQMLRRRPRELLAVGAAFVAGVFLAYFALGLGVVEVVVRFSLLQRFARVLNWVMAVFVAVVALLNLWDGVQCLRGRMGDMVLQLPRVLKTRIHDAVRVSSRHRHFVAASFLAGVLISFLELACTGQVYAPTLLYILKTGVSRRGALAYLTLYNVAFVIPLVIVFAGAYGGLRSERLTVWLRQRAALVKFATAALFATLFVILIRSRT
jgi:HEAT repeat protein/cytochrome c biogenesis protein CcdA/thiol-disulfide isomerase/thioredoxin